jgi:hypothetical protein
MAPKKAPKMRGNDIPEGVRAAVVIAKATKVAGYRKKMRRPTNKEIAQKLQNDFDIHVDERTISHITVDTEKRAFNAGVSRLDHRALTARENCQADERLLEREKQALVKRATLNREQRRKPWMQIYSECIKAGTVQDNVSRPTIYQAFRDLGYERCVPNKKPDLTPQMKETRNRWCKKHIDMRLDLVMYSDETGAQKGVHYKDDLCTRLTSEAWHEDCVDDKIKSSTGLMIAGSIAMNWQGAFHIYDREDAGERKATIQMLKDSAEPELNRRRTEWDLAWIRYKDLKARKEDKSVPWKERKHIKTGRRPAENPPTIAVCGPMRSEGGGIDWYRYQNEWLPELLPNYEDFCRYHNIKNQGEEVLLQQDKAPAHVSKWNDSIWDAHKVKWLEWPSNSPDLNPIEHIWDELKRTINRKYPREYDRENLKRIWREEWDSLPMDVINYWIEHTRTVMQRVIDQEGDNLFHG